MGNKLQHRVSGLERMLKIISNFINEEKKKKAQKSLLCGDHEVMTIEDHREE